MKKEKDWLDKLKIFFEIVAIVFAIKYGQIISTALKERELNIKMTEVAIGILTTEPSKESDSDPLREWAIEILDKYSNEFGVPISAEVRENLMAQSLKISYLLAEDGSRITFNGEPIMITEPPRISEAEPPAIITEDSRE
ncbi:MAG: hypothetical protein ISS70_10195 [Phycisphaerae bacterium]|nr:hypothetical protein [Phycisphaerae bacterium]